MSEPWADPNSQQTWSPSQQVPYQQVPYQQVPYQQQAPMMAPQGPRRPGITTAASVLGFVQAGFAIAGALVTLIGAIATSGSAHNDVFDQHVADAVALLLCVAIVQLAGSGVLIAGSVTLLAGRDRTMYMIGMAVQVALCVTYGVLSGIEMSRANGLENNSPAPGFLVFAIAFVVLPVLGLSFASTASTSRFLQILGPAGAAR